MKRYETSDLSPRLLFGLLLGLVIGAVVLDAGVGYGLRRVRAEMGPSGAPNGVGAVSDFTRFPEPRLEIDEGEKLRQYRERERNRLETYGWVDRARGIARIPVERAMVLDAAGK